MEREDILEALTILQDDLDQELDALQDSSSWREKIFVYLDKVQQNFRYCIPNESFDDMTGKEWINVASPLQSSIHLRGRLLLVDFFTYCCINCMHILPYLHRLEASIANAELIIIGVHSAKFDNEKVSDHVKSAVLRYGIEHAVLNDPEMRLWNLCQIICWPTLMLVGPNGEIIYKFIGEKNMSRFEAYVRIFIDYYCSRGQVTNSIKIPIKLFRESAESSKLCCPGKVAVNQLFLAIADSSNHRVLICDKHTFNVLYIIGITGKPGRKNDTLSESRFNSPQGICWYGRYVLFVADTENHSIRKIDLEAGRVTTIIGTGRQGEDYAGGRLGIEQEISSPWDLALYKDNVLFIAMTGTHQIWAYAINEDAKFFNRHVLVEVGKCVCIAGSGREENRNTTYPLKAGFAQPSGLALDCDHNLLIVADSESSTIRSFDLNSGSVKNICGGAHDPMNLFAFGDHDGRGPDAKLQHPLAVVWDFRSSSIIVADSYNHKLKIVDLKSRMCKTAQIKGTLCLDEPAGLAIDNVANRLYIADTNNHQIKVVELQNDEFLFSDEVIGPTLKFNSDSSDDVVDSLLTVRDFVSWRATDEGPLRVKSSLGLCLDLLLPNGIELNSDAPQTWTLRGDGLQEQKLDVDAIAQIEIKQERLTLQIHCSLVLCNELQKTCEMKQISRQLELIRDVNFGNSEIKVVLEI
ncbi:NHL repeat-containing protein 2-like isoform X1 [Varroa destructor]|uniref:Thioredoxin domain-containing protein n=1 Tax=Varroa destructor TaxID=109461 RepID=A0A7M7K847_VARDE|nr:NHL repeat-containing protein 2-like isoform X1 [Varroa destructor]